MNGSPPPHLRPHNPAVPLTASHHRLRHYNQQRLLWAHSINLTLSKLQSFVQQRRAQVSAEWLQKCFSASLARRQLNELTDYYRYYRNSPVVASPKYQELMNHYWQKTKALYYRKIKRELQLTDGTSEYSADQPIQQSAERISYLKATFQLPSQLKHSRHSLLLSFHHDPDATLRKLIEALNYKKQLKQQTREGSKIVQQNPVKLQQIMIKVQSYENTGKSHAKTHLRTNPSHLVSTSSFKKTKKKTQHKSLSNEPQKHSPHVYKEKKLNTMGSCQKIGVKQPQSTLNYQRRNKHPRAQKINKHPSNNNTNNPNNIHKPINTRQIYNGQRQLPNHVKTKEGSIKKGKSKQRSEKKTVAKRISVSKFKQVEKTNVKAAIDRAKVKIKAQKNIAMKKYIQSSHSCNKSNESLQADFRHSKK